MRKPGEETRGGNPGTDGTFSSFSAATTFVTKGPPGIRFRVSASSAKLENVPSVPRFRLVHPSEARIRSSALTKTLYSSRKACDGWITAARAAGSNVAQTATPARQAAAPAIDVASHGVIP